MPSQHAPLILVSADVRELETYTWHAAIDTYIRAAADVADVVPLLLPAIGPSILSQPLLRSVCGVLMTGSRSNVHPDRYGIPATPAHEPFDPARDATTLPLIRAAIERGIPLLAICRGHQELNVALGGTLQAEVQEEAGRMDHRVRDNEAPHDHRFEPVHTVTLTEGGMLERLLGQRELLVNSLHRQAIDRIADGLTVEARADDGTIEAVTVTQSKGFTLGLQWHPEYWASRDKTADAPSTTIFRAFGDAVRAYAATLGATSDAVVPVSG